MISKCIRRSLVRTSKSVGGLSKLRRVEKEIQEAESLHLDRSTDIKTDRQTSSQTDGQTDR